jgi:hypothetical protein
MSGFLQRIASSAVRPKLTAHPFVESIYPAARRQASAEPRERYETFAAPVEQAAERSSRSELFMEESRRTNKALAQPEGMYTQQPETATEREIFQPLLPQQEVEANVASKRSRHNGEEVTTVSSSASSVSQQELANSPTALEYVPLVADRLARTGISDPREIHPLPSSGEGGPVSARARQSAQVQPGARSTLPQGEDIQIHIGRIEVVAVPQAAPRPAAAPARKGMSLDEYLSRRNGRAG